MSPVPKANALRLASTAHELGAEALRGILEQNAAGRWTVGHIEIESWLSRHAGQELVLAIAVISQEAPLAYTRTCRTCGQEYEGPTCPHCEAVRSRLRGPRSQG
jgi:rubrerythrin